MNEPPPGWQAEPPPPAGLSPAAERRARRRADLIYLPARRPLTGPRPGGAAPGTGEGLGFSGERT